MVVSLKRHFATEQHNLEHCFNTYPKTVEHLNNLLDDISQYINLRNNFKILEIGAAQGKLVAACQSLGYWCVGIEPYEPAIQVSRELSRMLNVEINIDKGIAENIPYNNNIFDLVIAESVMEHVKDVNKVCEEVFRVLKPNGAFYFDTTSKICPRQGEIRYLPFFPWYPEKVKNRVMDWAIRNRPELIGYTERPAMNWFTPWTIHKLLWRAGFRKVYDRWDILSGTTFSFSRKIMLRIIKFNRLTKLLADFMLPGCGYLALKNDKTSN